MRDRLIELIGKGERSMWGKTIHGGKEGQREYLAGYLLANGVIVPPCKVGQTVYYLFQYSDTRILPFVRRAKIKRIYCCNSKMQFLIDGELKDTKEKGIIKTWYFDAFGKTVFLTREEAEAKLKEGAE